MSSHTPPQDKPGAWTGSDMAWTPPGPSPFLRVYILAMEGSNYHQTCANTLSQHLHGALQTQPQRLQCAASSKANKSRHSLLLSERYPCTRIDSAADGWSHTLFSNTYVT